MIYVVALNIVRSNTLGPRTFYTLYIGPNDNGTDHLIFKLSRKWTLITLKYKPVPMPEDLIATINEIDTFTTNIQIDHFHSKHYTAQEDRFDNIQDDGQDQWDDVDNSEHESYHVVGHRLDELLLCCSYC